MKKRRIFCQIFCNIQNFLELTCLIDKLDEVDMGLRNEKKNILQPNIYIVFLKNCYQWLKCRLHMQRINSTQKEDD